MPGFAFLESAIAFSLARLDTGLEVRLRFRGYLDGKTAYV